MPAGGLDDMAFRETVFAWLRARTLTTEGLTRDQLSEFEFNGRRHRLVGTQTGIWRVKDYSPAAISILTAHSPTGAQRPYDDSIGPDGLLRYRWRGKDPNVADNVWLRTAMELQLPLVWFIGFSYAPGTKTQVFRPEFPVWLVAEEPEQQQFVVAVEASQRAVPAGADATVIEFARSYNERIVRQRHHQPLFRSAVLYAYDRKCAVCRLPFAELLDAAHIKPDSEGGPAKVTNGLALCNIHHGRSTSNSSASRPTTWSTYGTRCWRPSTARRCSTPSRRCTANAYASSPRHVTNDPTATSSPSASSPSSRRRNR